MARFKKVVSAPGTYQTPDGTATVTPERIRHWADTINALVKEGIKPPISWGHSKDALPHPDADSEFWHARYVAGSLTGAEVDRAGQLVVHGDAPSLTMDATGRLVTAAPLPDGRMVPTVAEEVSIAACDWTDGTGRTWPDAPVHLALTPLPVWVPPGGQPPFEPTTEGEPRTQRFSLAGLLVRFATENNMADEKDDKPDKDKGGEGEGDGGQGAMLKKVLEKLTQVGVTLPDDTTPENLLERLYVAATAVAGEGGGEEPVLEQKEEAPMMMSTLAGIKDPYARVAIEELATTKRDRRLERIAALVDRGLPVAEVKRLREQASAVWFALGSDKKLAPHPVDPVLDALERALPPAAEFSLTRRMTGVHEEAPPEGDEAGKRKTSRELADRMARGIGLPARATDNGKGA